MNDLVLEVIAVADVSGSLQSATVIYNQMQDSSASLPRLQRVCKRFYPCLEQLPQTEGDSNFTTHIVYKRTSHPNKTEDKKLQE